MRGFFAGLILATCALASIVGPARADDAPRLALVIGQGDYNLDGSTDTPLAFSTLGQYPSDLQKPLNDAADVATSLRRLKFDVTQLENAKRADMLIAIAQFGRKVSLAGKRAIVMIYYSGHAMQVDGLNLLIPVGAQLPTGFDYRQFNANQLQEILSGETVSLPFIMQQLNDPEEGVNIIVLDSCRNNWWDSQIYGVSRGGGGASGMRTTRGAAERFFSLSSTLIAFSTQPGNVADDGAKEDRNSPYTRALKRHLERPHITVLQLFNYVALDVQRATREWNPPQTPWTNSAPLTDICLAGCRGENAALQEQKLEAAERRARELEAMLQAATAAPSAEPQTSPTALFRPLTEADLIRIAGNPKREFLPGLIQALNKYLPLYNVDTPERVAHFLGQAAHDSDNFRTMEEYASGEAYEGRVSLGNTQPGDGVRYKGRGIFQLTGRKNYALYGTFLGLDLEGNPQLASQPDIAVRIALEYWARNTRNDVSMNDLADRDDIEGITRRINGGLNGLEDRRRKLQIAKSILMPDPDATNAALGDLPRPGDVFSVFASGGLRLRNAPAIDSQVLAELPRGQLLHVLQDKAPQGWLYVSAELSGVELKGYVDARYVERITP